MLTEEVHADGVAAGKGDLGADQHGKVGEHEEAAHEKRNWVRLTYECNNRCIFCLDSQTHDGEMRDAEDVKKQILDGRRKGASRLILSGGEPTIHPRYVDFIKLGRMAGYRRVQTVTNGRLFRYPEFLDKCLSAGLQEITFSIHGPNARIHDALVGVKGAYEEEMEGLRAALADGRPIINVDIVIMRGNIKTLPDMLEGLYAEGVREFDVLQVVPFGRAFTEGRDTLFYDLDAHAQYVRAALEFSKRPDVHMWMNRFPPAHLEGFEHLIQDPYKLNDEVRGRKEEFTKQLDRGTPLECREPDRCKYCYLQRLCDTLEGVQTSHTARSFSRVTLDADWEVALPAVFGGDPASARRARNEAAAALEVASVDVAGPSSLEPAGVPQVKRALPVIGGKVTLKKRSWQELTAGIELAQIRAQDIDSAERELAKVPDARFVELDLPEWNLTADDVRDRAVHIGPAKLVRATAHRPRDAEQLLALDADFEVEVVLTQVMGAFLAGLDRIDARLRLVQPTYERLTEAADSDLDIPEFIAAFRGKAGADATDIAGLPECVTMREPVRAPETFDTTMATPTGELEIFRYARRYILDHYRVKSLRCGGCTKREGCDGLHINTVRAHGFGWMQPIR